MPNDNNREQIAETMRSATLVPETWRDEDNSVEVTFSTGARCMKFDWRRDEAYWEDLPLSGMNLSELNAGAHVLRAHESYSLNSVLGSVVPGTARVENGEAIARIRLSTEESDAEIVNKIRSGVIRKWSYGYRRDGKPTVATGEDGVQVRTWASHTPYEISPVPVPADGRTATRSQENTMKDVPKTEPQVEAPTPTVDEDALRKEGARAEAERREGIRAIAAKLRLSDEDIRGQLEDPDCDVEAFRVAAIDLVAERDAALETHPQHAARVVVGERQGHARKVEAMIEGLAYRALPRGEVAADAREYVNFSLLDMARECCEDAGIRTRGMTQAEVFNAALNVGRRYHSTSDFSHILSSATNKNLQTGYASEARNFQEIAQRRIAPDFRAIPEVALGSITTLDETPEGGELKYATISDRGETWQILSYTRGIRLTRQAMINDSLGALGTLPQRLGAAVARTELDKFWALFTANANMSDGNALFSTAHSNLTASGGDAPDVAQIGKGRTLLRKQTDVDGSRLSLIPSHIIIPAALETDVDQLLTGITPNQTSSVVPAAVRSLKPIVEPRLDASSEYFWYLAAQNWPSLVYGYLAGHEAPRLSSRESWEIQGIEMKIEHDFGCGVSDHRGLYRNKGQA